MRIYCRLVRGFFGQGFSCLKIVFRGVFCRFHLKFDTTRWALGLAISSEQGSRAGKKSRKLSGILRFATAKLLKSHVAHMLSSIKPTDFRFSWVDQADSVRRAARDCRYECVCPEKLETTPSWQEMLKPCSVCCLLQNGWFRVQKTMLSGVIV